MTKTTPTQRILIGDVRERLADLPAASVHCCVTSPPYFGLRDYGVAGQIGLEPTLAEYIATMVDVFRGVRRVLRDDGTLWLNIGDSYNAYNGNRGTTRSIQGAESARPDLPTGFGLTDKTLKQKDLMMVPARLAIALCDDGWWLRSDIIWHKKAPMPESVTDRPTSAHEHIFLLTKSPRYFYDADAVREDASPESDRRYLTGYAGNKQGHDRGDFGHSEGDKSHLIGVGRNQRNVWTLGPEPFPLAHFATFVTEIPRRCIKAGCPEGGTVLDPFLGSGTTLLVADELGRNGVGIELNPQYAEMARQRVYGASPLFASVEVA